MTKNRCQVWLGSVAGLAALVAIFALCGLSFLYPASTAVFTQFSWVMLLLAFMGIFLVGAVYVAMDLFASSLTESAVVAYVMAVTLNLAVWFIGMGAEAAFYHPNEINMIILRTNKKLPLPAAKICMNLPCLTKAGWLCLLSLNGLSKMAAKR